MGYLLYEKHVDMELEGLAEWFAHCRVIGEPLHKALALTMGLDLGLQVHMYIVAHDNVERVGPFGGRELVR